MCGKILLDGGVKRWLRGIFVEFDRNAGDDIAPGRLAAKDAIAVRKAAVVALQCDETVGLTVVGLERQQSVGNFLTIRPDVLNRCGSGSAGNARHGFDACQVHIDCALDDTIPYFAATDFECHITRLVVNDIKAGDTVANHDAVIAFVANDNVTAAAEYENG